MSQFPAVPSITASRRVRVIPTLLIDGRGRLVKTVKFGRRTYIGDPMNAVRIFNAKEVDELVLLDIDATREGRPPNYALIEDIVSEAFMPVGYGGGIRTMPQVQQLYKCGIEKVVVSSCLADAPGTDGTSLIRQASSRFGSQAVVVCLPVKRSLFGGYHVKVVAKSASLVGSPEDVARQVVADGAGELIVYAIDRDGTFAGYDLELLRRISAAVDVPVVACGGARQIDDFRAAIVDGGCSAAAAGSLFVYQSQGRGVLISYPSSADLRTKVFERLN
jgi:imidazole glycerol-phosphate synthase subunit HisF